MGTRALLLTVLVGKDGPPRRSYPTAARCQVRLPGLSSDVSSVKFKLEDVNACAGIRTVTWMGCRYNKRNYRVRYAELVARSQD